MEYRYTYSSGRNRTATERTGTRFHAVPVDDAYPYPASFTKALCGYQPGRRSNGWSDFEAGEVTCPRCIKKMDAASAAAA